MLCRAQSVIAKDYRRSALLSKFQRAVSSGASSDEIVCMCHEIMENPVWLLDDKLQLIAFSVAGKREILAPEALIRKGVRMDYRPVILEPDETDQNRRILGTILHEGKISGFILAFAMNKNFNDAADKEYVDMICSILSGRTHLNAPDSTVSIKERFVLELLQNRITAPTVIQQKLLNLRWPKSEKYYVLAIDMGVQHKSAAVKDRLKIILGEDVYDYSHYYVAIFGREISCNFCADDFPDLLKFLEEHNLFAGLSNAFWDFSMLSRAFEQSAISIPLRKRFSGDVRFARYEDLILVHLLDIANENGIPVLSFCHPVVNKIHDYDRENDTDYLKTLAAYVFNNLNLQQTSEVLFIHRNTLYHRIAKMKELFSIDFDNRRLFMKLRISVTIYNYLGKVDTLHLWGPLI